VKTDGAGGPAAEPPTTTGVGAIDSESSKGGNAGCSVGAGTARGASLSGLGALALAALLLRRRRRS
jgi:MYXO-CTERM domain-containing protein